MHLDAAILHHRDDHAAFLVSLLDIAVRLDHFFQRIAPVDDRLDHPRLDLLFEGEQDFD